MSVGDRGWAQRLLAWRAGVGPVLEAEISRVKYFVRGDRHKVVAWGRCGTLAVGAGSRLGCLDPWQRRGVHASLMRSGVAGVRMRRIVRWRRRWMCGYRVGGAEDLRVLLGSA